MVEPSDELQVVFEKAIKDAKKLRHEYVTLEHLFFAMLCSDNFVKVLDGYGCKVDSMKEELNDHLQNKIDEINKVEKEFRQKQQTLQQELQSKQNSELNRIRVIVENAINEYAKDNDYDLILRADGTTLYAKTYVDITQEIIEKLN